MNFADPEIKQCYDLADADQLTTIDKENEKGSKSRSGSPVRDELSGDECGHDDEDGGDVTSGEDDPGTDVEQYENDGEDYEGQDTEGSKDEHEDGGHKIRINIESDDDVYDDFTADEGEEDDYDHMEMDEIDGGAEVVTARPRRMSEYNMATEKPPIPAGSAFFIFSSTNRFRVFCHWVQNHSYFGNFILACIMISSAMLAAEDPLNALSERNVVRLNKLRFLPRISTVTKRYRVTHQRFL